MGAVVVPVRPWDAASMNRKPVGLHSTPSPVASQSSVPAAIQDAPQVQAEVAEAPKPPASAPLKLDAATIRAANHASKSEVMKMAAISGTYIGDDPVSESEKLTGAIARTAKEDCLGPKAGGSLLSLFVIAYQAAKGECK
jgi:hypothetical protein